MSEPRPLSERPLSEIYRSIVESRMYAAAMRRDPVKARAELRTFLGEILARRRASRPSEIYRWYPPKY